MNLFDEGKSSTDELNALAQLMGEMNNMSVCFIVTDGENLFYDIIENQDEAMGKFLSLGIAPDDAGFSHCRPEFIERSPMTYCKVDMATFVAENPEKYGLTPRPAMVELFSRFFQMEDENSDFQ